MPGAATHTAPVASPAIPAGFGPAPGAPNSFRSRWLVVLKRPIRWPLSSVNHTYPPRTSSPYGALSACGRSRQYTIERVEGFHEPIRFWPMSVNQG